MHEHFCKINTSQRKYSLLNSMKKVRVIHLQKPKFNPKWMNLKVILLTRAHQNLIYNLLCLIFKASLSFCPNAISRSAKRKRSSVPSVRGGEGGDLKHSISTCTLGDQPRTNLLLPPLTHMTGSQADSEATFGCVS